MDYEILELWVGAVLFVVAVAAIVTAGRWSLKEPQRRMPLFFFLGLAASAAYAMGAGTVARAIFPPPYDPVFAGGRGLDLRGMFLAMGALAGGAAGVVGTMVFVVINLVREPAPYRSRKDHH